MLAGKPGQILGLTKERKVASNVEITSVRPRLKQFDVNENRWCGFCITKTCQASLSFMKMSSVTVTLRSSWVKFGIDLRVTAVERFVSS